VVLRLRDFLASFLSVLFSFPRSLSFLASLLQSLPFGLLLVKVALNDRTSNKSDFVSFRDICRLACIFTFTIDPILLNRVS
jgi:hypothetical protein